MSRNIAPANAFNEMESLAAAARRLVRSVEGGQNNIMKLVAIITIAPLVLLVPLLAFGQAGGGRGSGTRLYDPSTETTVKGTVEKVVQQTGNRGSSGTHVVLKTDSGDLTVHVGPSSYISAQGFSFAKGDALEVTGSKVKMGEQDVLLAREIKKDGKVLTLRDAQGFPKWSRGSQRPN
jgi:hypothetical protein